MVLRGKFGFEYRLDVMAGEERRVRYALRPCGHVGSSILDFLALAVVLWDVGRAPEEVLYEEGRVARQAFRNMRAWFSQEGKCVRVDFFGSADLRCGGVPVIGGMFGEIMGALHEIDEDVVVRRCVVASKGLGLAVICRIGESGLIDEAHVCCMESCAAGCAEMPGEEMPELAGG